MLRALWHLQIPRYLICNELKLWKAANLHMEEAGTRGLVMINDRNSWLIKQSLQSYQVLRSGLSLRAQFQSVLRSLKLRNSNNHTDHSVCITRDLLLLVHFQLISETTVGKSTIICRVSSPWSSTYSWSAFIYITSIWVFPEIWQMNHFANSSCFMVMQLITLHWLIECNLWNTSVTFSECFIRGVLSWFFFFTIRLVMICHSGSEH